MQKFFEYQLVDDISMVALCVPQSDSVKPCGTQSATMVVNCLNPHSFVSALDDEVFHNALLDSDYLLPDGEGICMTLKMFRGVVLHKIAGDDLHKLILEELSKKGGRIFYMGSSSDVLSLIESRLAKEHPSIKVRTLSPTYCDELSEDESMQIIAEINDFKPDVLFVSMTAPKQEKWLYKYRGQLQGVKMAASIGGVFEFYAGTLKRAPKWAIKMHIEWLVRLIKEPQRMWKRNFVSTPKFLHWVWKHRKEC